MIKNDGVKYKRNNGKNNNCHNSGGYNTKRAAKDEKNRLLDSVFFNFCFELFSVVSYENTTPLRQLSARLFLNESSTFFIVAFDSEPNFGVVSLFLSMVLI